MNTLNEIGTGEDFGPLDFTVLPMQSWSGNPPLSRKKTFGQQISLREVYDEDDEQSEDRNRAWKAASQVDLHPMSIPWTQSGISARDDYPEISIMHKMTHASWDGWGNSTPFSRGGADYIDLEDLFDILSLIREKNMNQSSSRFGQVRASG